MPREVAAEVADGSAREVTTFGQAAELETLARELWGLPRYGLSPASEQEMQRGFRLANQGQAKRGAAVLHKLVRRERERPPLAEPAECRHSATAKAAWAEYLRARERALQSWEDYAQGLERIALDYPEHPPILSLVSRLSPVSDRHRARALPANRAREARPRRRAATASSSSGGDDPPDGGEPDLASWRGLEVASARMFQHVERRKAKRAVS